VPIMARRRRRFIGTVGCSSMAFPFPVADEDAEL